MDIVEIRIMVQGEGSLTDEQCDQITDDVYAMDEPLAQFIKDRLPAEVYDQIGVNVQVNP